MSGYLYVNVYELQREQFIKFKEKRDLEDRYRLKGQLFVINFLNGWFKLKIYLMFCLYIYVYRFYIYIMVRLGYMNIQLSYLKFSV